MPPKPALAQSAKPSLAKQSSTKSSKPKKAYWPNWRGPHFDGISREKNWRKSWKEKPTILWEKQVGIGYSGVAVADGRAYTLGHKDGQETVFCLNAKTGKELWHKKYESELVDNLNAGGPGATPTIDGDFVYTNSRGGHVYCFNAKSGNVVWKIDLRKELGLELPEWGFTCSPLIYNDWLILDANRVLALNKKTGQRIWASDEHEPGYGTPTVFKHEGEMMLATLNCDGVKIVRAKNGSTVATFDWDSPFATNSTTPIVVGDKIYISTGYGRGCVLLKLADGKLTPIYQNRKMKNHFNNSVLYKGKLYGFDGNSNLGRVVKVTCMDFETGNVEWIQRGFGCGSLLVADDKLILLSDRGVLATAEATHKEFKEISRAKILNGECWTVPVLAGGLLYCRDSDGHLVCVDLRVK